MMVTRSTSRVSGQKSLVAQCCTARLSQMAKESTSHLKRHCTEGSRIWRSRRPTLPNKPTRQRLESNETSLRETQGESPDFARLYPRRNDAESINRNLDDTLWLRRAHSIGHQRQLLNLLGYALMVNGLALHRHRRRHPITRAALAA